MDVDNKYGLRQTHIELISALKVFDELCREESIRYSLAFGTLIGAVRDGGLIPWDDDIDVVLSRREYERLLQVMKKRGNRYGEYRLDLDWWLGKFKKITDETIWIDLFVLDNEPDNKILAKIKLFSLMVLQGLIKTKVNYKDYQGIYRLLTIVLSTVGKLIPRKIKLLLYRGISTKGNLKRTKRIQVYNTLFSDLVTGRLIFDSKILYGGVKSVEFEGVQTKILNRYDEFLRTCYGDYMTPPPEKDRKPSHRKNDM